jgi:hypothetical protein
MKAPDTLLLAFTHAEDKATVEIDLSAAWGFVKLMEGRLRPSAHISFRKRKR